MTTIEWARNADGSAGKTWNPTSGCDRISPGCDHCYALTMAKRLKLMGQAKYQNDGDPRTSGPGFGLTLHHDVLSVPLTRRKPTTWFVNSMSDLFHQEVPEGFIGSVWGTMALAERHTFQVLTKRPQRMATLLTKWAADTAGTAYGGPSWRDHRGMWNESRTWPLPNVWLGTSIESDRYAFRADHLRATPAAVRFLSLEPLLGPLPSLDFTGIDWVIAGAESGHGARAMDLDWVRDLRDRATAAGAAFFFKQSATPAGRKVKLPELDGEQWVQMPARRKALA
jgi:protein gp37